jgi:8-oxo-dGTP pyrophosphatase MutT (NUDIX family)
MTNSNKSCDHEPPEWARSLSAAVGKPQSHSGPLSEQTGTPRAAAVLVLLTDGPNRVQVLLTERASGLRSYPGRVSFPGGAQDPTDADPTATALREAHEEIGLDPASVHILGSLPTFADPLGKFIVTPVLAWSACPDFTGPVSSAEVAKIHQVAIRDLSAAHGTGQPSEGSAALASQLGEMTAAIVGAVVALLNGPTPHGSNDIHPEPPRD